MGVDKQQGLGGKLLLKLIDGGLLETLRVLSYGVQIEMVV